MRAIFFVLVFLGVIFDAVADVRGDVERGIRWVRAELPYLRAKRARYFPLIDSCLRKYGLPLQLKYVAVIESGLDASAESAVGAKGMWQFMPETARLYGLIVSDSVDERTDARKSTMAACKYFRDLYSHFHSWELAICAFNAGIGRVSRLLEVTQKESYWEIRHLLPKEGQEYLPKLMAVCFVIEGGTMSFVRGFKDSLLSKDGRLHAKRAFLLAFSWRGDLEYDPGEGRIRVGRVLGREPRNVFAMKTVRRKKRKLEVEIKERLLFVI